MTGGEGYAQRHLRQSDYYDQSRTVEGRWHGRGAELLGLKGGVTSEDFEAVRQGLDPQTGEFLRQRHGADRVASNGEEQSKARSLYDMTFSAPKSVSVMATVGGDERLVAAHETAGQRFPYYFCWNRDCKHKVYVSQEQLELQYFSLLSVHSADAALLAQLPVLAARMWSSRQETIANDARLLVRRLDEQKDFELMKFSIEAEMQKIENEIKALDSEKSKMEELIKQREEEPVNFGNAWRNAPFRQKIEMQRVFYPDGLVYHFKTHFFEPRNTYYFHQLAQCFSDLLEVGVPDGI